MRIGTKSWRMRWINNVQIAAYDRLEKNFDYTDSMRAVESRNGHNRGTRFSSNDDPDNTLFHLNDLDESTVYQSSAYADAAQKVIVTADMQKSKFIDRIQISPAKDKDGGTTGFPKSFYIELSNDMSNWTIVAARSDYPVPAETAVFRIAAQSARYIRLVATELGAAEHKFSLCLSEMDAYFDDYHNQGYERARAVKYYVSSSSGGDGNVYVQANFGVIRNSKFVESYDGQGFLTGYEVAGDKSMMNGHKVGTYDTARDVTYYGIVMDMDSNRIYAPDGTTLKAGKDADPVANGVESYGKEWQIGKMDGGNFVKSDELVSESGGNSAKYLADGELSAMYDYHRGFSTIDLASSSVDLAFQVDLGAVTTLTAVRMYGVQNLSFDASVWNNAEYGYLLPKSFTVYTSEDGETWTQRKIRALSSEGGYVRGGVDKIIDFKPTTARATNDFVFADIEVNARYVRIVVDGANAVAGTSGVWRVEIGELQVISSFDTNVDYVYPETGRKGD